MGKLELEVKILDIDKEKFIKKLEKLGAKLKKETKQYLYTYDLPTIYGRYVDIMMQLNNPESEIKYETAVSKLKLLFFDLDNLIDKEKIKKVTGYNTLTEILKQKNMLEILNSRKFINFIKKYQNNPKKWIRIRQTNDKTTITVKHILKDNNTNLQQMMETEMDVPSIKEANALLEALGYSYKSYQEKERITYIFEDYEIDIDTWPGIPTYFEIEGNTEEELDIVLKKLGYSIKEAVSCTADQVYEKYGKSMFDKREIKF